jgi:L-ascorbate metabolism protein UlaG (beta-lactamase superfamily)
MNGEEAIETTKLLNPNIVIPIHYEGWWHFKQSVSSLKNEIKKSGQKDKFLWLKSGIETELRKSSGYLNGTINSI